MSRIDITHPHRLPLAQARVAVDGVARSLQQRFGVRAQWRDDTLLFSGDGVDGRIVLEAERLHLQATLGGILSMLRGPIEAKIRDVLRTRLDGD